MSDMIKRLRERRANVWEQAKGLADKAAEENRAFSAEEQGTWDALNDELNKLDERIKSAIDTAQRGKDADAAFDRLSGGQGGGSGAGGQGGGQRQGGSPAGQAPQDQGELRAWMRGEGGGRFYDVKPNGPIDFRSLTKGSATAGGNTVPTSFYDRLIAHLIQTSAILQSGATVLNTDSGETIQVPKTTAHSSGAIVTEGGTIGTSEPTFGQISLGAYKYGALIQVSRELLDDTGVDLEGYLAMQAGRALGNAFGAHAITGTGTGQPRGVVTDATTGVTGGTGVTGAFTSDNVIDLFFSVIAPYRRSTAAVWMMADSSIAALRKLKDSTGQYLWQPGLQAGAPDMILGKPVLMDPNVAAVALSAKALIFGDMSQYFVRLAGGGIRFERSDEFAFNSDMVTFRALMRADGALVDLTGAVKTFVGGAS